MSCVYTLSTTAFATNIGGARRMVRSPVLTSSYSNKSRQDTVDRSLVQILGFLVGMIVTRVFVEIVAHYEEPMDTEDLAVVRHLQGHRRETAYN